MMEWQMWAWILQLTIISAAIYLFLRLARQSRGNRVVRLLVTAGLLVVVALWGLTESLDLAELQHILSSVTGFVVVVLAIVFQPELRRAMGQLAGPGGGLGRRRDQATIGQVAAAAKAMGKRRCGALITFERESSLAHWCDRGVAIDARVDRSLLESIFERTSPLHDGGVVVHKGRIVASNCVYPLTENQDLARRYGTRHRAALGLSEETDAVTLIVSEETGRISIASGGELHGPIDEENIESELSDAVGGDKRKSTTQRSLDVVGGINGALRELARDLYWIAISLVLGAGILYVARGQVVQEESIEVEIELRTANSAPRESARDRGDRPVIVVDLQSAVHAFDDSSVERETYSLRVRGTRSQLSRFQEGATGKLPVSVDDAPVQIEIDDVSWNTDVLGLEFEWEKAPRDLTITPVARHTLRLEPRHVALDTSELKLNTAVSSIETRFEPEEIQLRGSEQLPDELRADGAQPLFAPVLLGEDPDVGERYPLELADHWKNAGVQLLTPEVVAVPKVSRSLRRLGSVTVGVALVCLDPERADEIDDWKLPSTHQTVPFQIEAIGVLPVEGDPRDLSLKLTTFVRDNLVAYVDVSGLDPTSTGPPSLQIRYHYRHDFKEPSVLAELGIQADELSTWSDIVARPTLDTVVVLEPVDSDG